MNTRMSVTILSQHRRLPLARLFAAALAALCTQVDGHAQTQGHLPFSRSYLVTGNYVVGGVDLNEQDHPILNGFSTGAIQMSNAVPANADIVAAHLFWETITLEADESQASGVKFRGFDIDLNSVLTVKKESRPLSGSTAPCWSSGVPLAMRMYRADVLRFLPIQVDANDKPTGKRLVNDADLAAHGFGPHTVTLPVRSGNAIPESAGATLVAIYRDPAQPLRKIVIYDGIHIKALLDTAMEQNLQGFYKSAATKSAKLTHIVASGQPNLNERISFNNVLLSMNPFPAGSTSQRAWGNPTYDVSSLMNPGSASGIYGETATTKVFHEPAIGGQDCLTWGAVVFSTAVADVDQDGLPDGLEDATDPLKDPDGSDLPDLNAMGAGSDQKDLFVEVNAMRAEPGTTYGSPAAPYSAAETTKTDAVGHHHMPTPEVLKMVGDAFAAHGIRAHFDVGDTAAYHALGVIQHTDWVDDYTSTAADAYLIPSGLARGGEWVTETACDPLHPQCHFPAFPGTVGWKYGLQFHRDAPVTDSGGELTAAQLPAWLAGTTQRRRFDPVRRGVFHYLFYGHARGKPKSLPCLVDGHPAPYDLNDGTACTTPNPDFHAADYHVPSSVSGVADLPGGSALVTLGLWDEFVGRPFARAGTTFHELGHNLGLFHGGVPVAWGNKALNTTTYIEPNCKPNYLSSMSYLFQVHGLFDEQDGIHLDYSGTAYSGLNEAATLGDSALFPVPAYRPAWFAPANSTLASMLGMPPATRFCGGGKFDPANPPAPMTRVHSDYTNSFVDWNGDTFLNEAIFGQDVNFDGILTAAPNLFNGFDDWGNIRLDQVGGARDSTRIADGSGDIADLFGGDIADLFGGDFADLFGGDVADLFGGDLADLFGGDVADLFGGDLADLFGGDVADLFGGDLADLFGGDQLDMSYDTAKGLGRTPPYSLRPCVIGRDPGCTQAPPLDPLYHRVELRFTPPPVGSYPTYEIQRKRAAASDDTFVTIGSTSTNRFVDTTELADGVQYAYRVRGVSAEANTGWSRSGLVTATNDAPVAVGESYVMLTKTTLTVTGPGVLANDADGDSPSAFIGRRAILVTGPATGTFALNADGSFTFTPPKNGFVGVVSFTYKADDGVSADAPVVPLSPASQVVTVTITVTK